ncbi:MAG: hypothetical protein QNJ97_16330 [Myxococcota bacterium]|nr:hypothetical protein [Myxococcota bacterium]
MLRQEWIAAIKRFVVTLMVVLFGTGPALAAVVHVPSPIDAAAVFVTNPSGQEPTDPGVVRLTATGHDGARMVVDRAAVITAAVNTRVRITSSDDRPKISLEGGGVRVQAGSKGVLLLIDAFTLHAIGVELLLTRFEGSWLVHVVALLPQGTATIVPTVVPSPPATQATEVSGIDTDAAAPPAPAPISLKSKETLRLKGDADPRIVNQAEAAHLKNLALRLSDRPGSIELVPEDIEDPADTAIAHAAGEDATAEVEIEDIEVEIEADCIEICMD